MPEGGDEGEDEEHNDKDGDASTGEIGDCCGGGVTGRKNDRGRWGTAMIKKERTRKRLDLDGVSAASRIIRCARIERVNNRT